MNPIFIDYSNDTNYYYYYLKYRKNNKSNQVRHVFKIVLILKLYWSKN